MEDWHISLHRAMQTEPWPGTLSALLMMHGTMSLRFYRPRGRDAQTPHDQDEIYIVTSGTGTFASGPNERTMTAKQFAPGDAIFVPAGHVHRFTHFSGDFATWVVFWGRKGGEA